MNQFTSESARAAVKAKLATPEGRAAHVERARQNLAMAHATPEARARRLAQLAEARAKTAWYKRREAQERAAIRAQEDADAAFIVANNLLARSAMRGHIVDRLMTGGVDRAGSGRLSTPTLACRAS